MSKIKSIEVEQLEVNYMVMKLKNTMRYKIYQTLSKDEVQELCNNDRYSIIIKPSSKKGRVHVKYIKG